RSGARTRSASASAATVRAGGAESAVANGFQKSERMESGDWTAVGAGRLQSLRVAVAGDLDDARGSVWSPSARRYHPNPPEWEYGSGSEVQRLGPHGQLKLEGRWWQVCEALAGEAVQLQRVQGRVLVYYCQTLVREIDLVESSSTAFPPSLRSVGNAVELEKV